MLDAEAFKSFMSFASAGGGGFAADGYDDELDLLRLWV